MAALLLAAPADAEDEVIRLPFLLADGVERPAAPSVPVLLPRWSPGWGDELEERESAPVPTLHYPVVEPMLRSVSDGWESHRGQVMLSDGADRGRSRALTLAVRAGFSRRVRIEVDVRHGDRPAARLRGEAPPGARLVSDAREERVYPAGLELDPRYAHAGMRRVPLGPRIVASVAEAGRFLVLRLAVHDSRAIEDVRFASDELTLVAPRIAFASLVGEFPAEPGRTHEIRLGELRSRIVSRGSGRRARPRARAR